MLNSPWFHFYLEFRNALCNTLHHDGFNSCWFHPGFMLNVSKSVKTIRFLQLEQFFLEKSRIIVPIVFNTKNPVECLVFAQSFCRVTTVSLASSFSSRTAQRSGFWICHVMDVAPQPLWVKFLANPGGKIRQFFKQNSRTKRLKQKLFYFE